MKRLAFLSRVAFICNLCFLLTWIFRYYAFVPAKEIESTIIVAGLVLSFMINALVNILYGMLLLRKIHLSTFVPVWVGIVNCLFFILQVYFIVKS